MCDNLDEYVPREYYTPTIAGVLSKHGFVGEENQFSTEGLAILNGRALKWLNGAASYAYATLNVIINLYPEDNAGKKCKKYFSPILKELSGVIKNAREDEIGSSKLNKEIQDQRIRDAVRAVAHAGNIFNNTCALLPDSILKAVLEARDVCEEALRQPRLIPI